MYMYVYTCIYIVCRVYIYTCVYLLRVGKSWQRLQNGARCRWTTRLSLVHSLISHYHLGPHVRQPRFLPRIVPHETEECV